MADTTTSSSLLTANQGWASKTAVDTALRGSYWFAVQPRLANAAVDQGAYTVEAALTDATGLVTKKTFPVSFVSSLAYLTGATVTNSISGTFNTGSALTVGTTYVKSTLKDSAGGRVVIAKRDPATSGYLPTLKARLLDSTGVQVQANTTFNVSDTGTSGYDLYQATPDSATAWTSWGDGVYGVNTVSTITAAAPTDGTSLQMEVTLNGTTSRDTDNITIVGSQSGYGTATVSGTGIIDSASTAGTTAASYLAPLTATKATVSVFVATTSGGSTGLANQPVTMYTTWTTVGTHSADLSPKSGATYATVVTTDANGYATYTVTNLAPVDTDAAVVTFAGLTTGGTATITWNKSKPKTITVDPVGPSVAVALKSTNKATFTVTDAFGKPVSGAAIKLAYGSSTNANYSSAGIATAVTDANGQVSYSLTDAAAAAGDSDKIVATSVDVSTATSNITWSYVAAVKTATLVTQYYSLDEGTTAYAVPSAVALGGTGLALNQGKDVTASLTPSTKSTTDDVVGFQPIFYSSAGVVASGVPVTVTADAGGWVLNSAGLPVQSRTFYTNTSGQITASVTATTPGIHSYTFASGTASVTSQVVFANTNTARFLTVTNNKDNSVTAKVTDNLGNGVSGVTISVAVSGGPTLAGGALSAQWTTDSTGVYTFTLASSSSNDATVKVSASATTSQLNDPAGYIGSTVTAGVKAGVSSSTSTVSVTGSSTTSDAIDAANEATDAANAATDAANAAAEAADAATAAAQDAQAAVAALASQVADLIAGIKAQIASLTNLVIKIQKKVKA